jgi:hypothetical protein
MISIVSLVYGPIAAFLVELFPTKIRYTSMSLPYHLGSGVFGGLTPLIGVSMQSQGIFGGLYYPLAVSSVCLLVMVFFVPETFNRPLDESQEDNVKIDRKYA